MVGESARRRLYTVLNAARSLVRGFPVVQSVAVAPRLPMAGLGPVVVQPIGVQNGRNVRAGAGKGVRSLALVLAESMSTAE